MRLSPNNFFADKKLGKAVHKSKINFSNEYIQFDIWQFDMSMGVEVIEGEEEVKGHRRGVRASIG